MAAQHPDVPPAPEAAENEASSHGAQVGIEIRVALSTLLGRDEQPGEIPGLGLLPAPATRARVALQRRAQWRFAVTDTTGRLLSEGVTRRRPASVGEHPVHRHGPPGGIVEIHIPQVLLEKLTAGGPAEWAGVLADVGTPRSATAPASSPAAATEPTPPRPTTPATTLPAAPPSPPTPARCATTTTTSSTAVAGG